MSPGVQRAWYLFANPWGKSEDKGLSLLRQPGKEDVDTRWETAGGRMSQWNLVRNRKHAGSPEMAGPPRAWSRCPWMEEEGD